MIRRRRRQILLLAAAVVVVAVVLVLRHAGEWLRAEIEQRLQARFVPTVKLTGPLALRLLPSPALSLGGFSLTAADGTPLLAAGPVAVEVDARVFADTPVVAAVRVEAVAATLVRDADGSWQAQDWLRPAPSADSSQAPPLPHIERVVIADGRLRVADAVSGAAFELSGLRFAAGPLAWGETAGVELGGAVVLRQPVAASGRFHLDARVQPSPAAVAVEAARLDVAGEGGGWSLVAGELGLARVTMAAEGGLRAAGGRFELRLVGPAGRGEVEAELGGLAGAGTVLAVDEITLRAAAHTPEGEFSGRLAVPAATLEGGRWRLPAGEAVLSATLAERGALAAKVPFAADGEGRAGSIRVGPGTLTLPHPGAADQDLAVSLGGEARFEAGALAGEVAGSFERSRFEGSWRYRADAEVPLALTAELDRLDADRYLAPASGKEEAPDLDALLSLPLHAELRIGELRLRGAVARDARLRYDPLPAIRPGPPAPGKP